MATPAKSYIKLVEEGKSHRTKSELKAKLESERANITGISMEESDRVKNDPRAHKIFEETRQLFAMVNKDDAIYQDGINWYAHTMSKVEAIEDNLDALYLTLKCLNDKYSTGEMTMEDYILAQGKLNDGIVHFERQINAKNGQLNSFRDKNIMTVTSTSRTIPEKKPKEKKNGVLDAMGK